MWRMKLTLRSPAFEPETPIPARFDHERGDLFPILAWDGAPDSTAGLVLLADDPDAPAEARAGASGFGRPGYPGPAPPPGDDPHHYVFRLLAVDEPVAAAEAWVAPVRMDRGIMSRWT